MNIFEKLKDAFYSMQEFEEACKKVSMIGINIKSGYSKLHTIPTEFYQDNFRFYLDEYDGQKELRKEWFDTVVYRHNYEIDEIVNNFCYFESDQIFNNRWIKRG